jgi:hypothetical protein
MDEFEAMMKSQMTTLKNQMGVIKEYIDTYDQRSMKLRQTITNELIVALISRFEKNEKMLNDINEKIDNVKDEMEMSNAKVQSSMERSIKEIKEEISQVEMEKAIAKIFQDREIKVNSKALQDLRQ